MVKTETLARARTRAPTPGSRNGVSRLPVILIISLAACLPGIAWSQASAGGELPVDAPQHHPKRVSRIPDQEIPENSPFELDVSVHFEDPDGDPLTFEAEGLPDSLSLSETGLLTGTPGQADIGKHRVSISAVDPSERTASDRFNLTVTEVDEAPIITGQVVTPMNVNEDEALTVTPQDLEIINADGDTNGMTIDILAGADYSVSGGNSLQPDQDFNGALIAPVTVTVDGQTSNIFDVVIVVLPVNDAPVLVIPIEDAIAIEDQDFALYVSQNFSDIEGDVLAFSATGLPDSLTMDTSGVISGIPLNEDTGNHSVIAIARDSSGAETNDSFNLAVTNTNDPPELTTPIGDQNTAEDSPFELDLKNFFNDPDGDELLFTATGLPASLLVDPDGVITGVPDQPDVGVHEVRVTANDNQGESVAASFGLTINDSNDPPRIVAPIGDQSATQNVDFHLDVSSFFDDQDGDDLSFSATGLPPSLSLSAQGLIDGRPVQSDVGEYRIQVTATDPSNETGSQYFTLTVTDVNDPPELTSPIGNRSTAEDQFFSLDVALNFADPEGSALVFDAVGLPSSIVLDTRGLMQGTPDQNDVGTHSVTVTATDPSGESVSDAFTLTVSGINDPPILVTPIGPQIAEEDIGFILDISDRFTDPDGDTLGYFASGLPVSLAIGNAGIISGTPLQEEVGEYLVSVEARDPSGAMATDTFTLQIEPTNDTPQLESEIPDQQALEGELFQLKIMNFFADDDGDELTYSASGLPESGNIDLDTKAGIISGIPAAVDTRDFPYEVAVNATDPDGASATGNFLLTIAAFDRANVSLEIDVTPSPAMLGDDTRWTFAARNGGPSPVDEQLLTGNFTGNQLAIEAVAPSNCSVEQEKDQTTVFSCSFGALTIGSTAFVVFSVSSNTTGDIVAHALTSSANNLPIDPNTSDNGDQQSVSVAQSLSNGAVQTLGDANARSSAAGDIDGDGDLDLVLGTAAGRLVEIYEGSGYRFFTEPARTVSDNSATEGIALSDLDGDGDLDMILANTGGQPNRIFKNDGAGIFQVLLELDDPDSRDVAVGDFNGDGLTDLVFASVQGNPVYLADGSGGFSLFAELGIARSFAVSAVDLNADDRPDLVFANVGAPSTVWLNTGGTGFAPSVSLPIGDAVAVVAFDRDGDGDLDLAFGRVPATPDDISSNPVLDNDGSGRMQVAHQLGSAPTLDIHAGDVDGDGLNDLVFINSTGTHQIWNATATGFELYEQQIDRIATVAGVLADFGNEGGLDLALGGGTQSGADIYLNDGSGKLGMGDAVPPTITLIGGPTLRMAAGTTFTDPGATAEDNIDGDLSTSVTTQGSVNAQIVGDYTITYNVSDRAGNSAEPQSRKVSVTPAAGTGGGGGGSLGLGSLLIMLLAFSALGSRKLRRST